MRRSGPSLLVILFLAVAAFLSIAEAACAGGPDSVLAGGGYWHRFLKYWGGIFGSVGGVVMVALGVGAVSLLIITRGKWKK